MERLNFSGCMNFVQLCHGNLLTRHFFGQLEARFFWLACITYFMDVTTFIYLFHVSYFPYCIKENTIFSILQCCMREIPLSKSITTVFSHCSVCFLLRNPRLWSIYRFQRRYLDGGFSTFDPVYPRLSVNAMTSFKSTKSFLFFFLLALEGLHRASHSLDRRNCQ